MPAWSTGSLPSSFLAGPRPIQSQTAAGTASTPELSAFLYVLAPLRLWLRPLQRRLLRQVRGPNPPGSLGHRLARLQPNPAQTSIFVSASRSGGISRLL